MSHRRRCEGFVQREIILLLAITVAVLPLFVLTRAAAAWNRRTHAEAAAYWYNRGKTLAATDSDATEFYRSAVVNDRDNLTYGLALASELAHRGRLADARRTLLRLRESSPEDPDINLQLARLAAKESKPAEAVRYYHIALDQLWAGEEKPGEDKPGRLNQRIETQIEIIEFLLRHHMRNQALSELLALTAELPEGAPSFDRAGQLFLDAGDPRRALESFNRALKIDRHDEKARAGAEQSRQLLAAESPLRPQPLEPSQQGPSQLGPSEQGPSLPGPSLPGPSRPEPRLPEPKQP